MVGSMQRYGTYLATVITVNYVKCHAFINISFLICIQALSCLVQIASVRRSLFSNTERAKFLTHLVSGVKHVLQNPQVYHDYFKFCERIEIEHSGSHVLW